jgi:hypothetical protein
MRLLGGIAAAALFHAAAHTRRDVQVRLIERNRFKVWVVQSQNLHPRVTCIKSRDKNCAPNRPQPAEPLAQPLRLLCTWVVKELRVFVMVKGWTAAVVRENIKRQYCEQRHGG